MGRYQAPVVGIQRRQLPPTRKTSVCLSHEVYQIVSARAAVTHTSIAWQVMSALEEYFLSQGHALVRHDNIKRRKSPYQPFA